MKAKVLINNETPGYLTTDRAESTYGQPVLIIDGKAYGVEDQTPFGVAGYLALISEDGKGTELISAWVKQADLLNCGYSLVKPRRINKSNISFTVPAGIDIPMSEYYVQRYVEDGKVILKYVQS